MSWQISCQAKLNVEEMLFALSIPLLENLYFSFIQALSPSAILLIPSIFYLNHKGKQTLAPVHLLFMQPSENSSNFSMKLCNLDADQGA